MQLELQVYLNDILRSIDEIDSYFDGVIREFVFFVGDKKTQRAIERNLEIIGEAANRIYKIDPSIDLPDIRKIVETRNRIIINHTISIALMVFALFIVQNKSRETPGFKVFGMTASTVIRLIYLVITIYVLLIIGYLVLRKGF